jgi:hypothetical protein
MSLSKLLFPHRCYNGGTQHNFSARYSQHNKSTDNNTAFWYSLGNPLPPQDEEIETYHGDVCQWCGKVVNKNEK